MQKLETYPQCYIFAGHIVHNAKDFPSSILSVFLTMDVDIANLLLEAAGIKNGTWVYLQKLHNICNSHKEQLASALYIQVHSHKRN